MISNNDGKDTIVVDKEVSIEAQTRFVVNPTIFIATLPLGVATPSVLSLSRLKGNGSVNTITNFIHGQDGQSIEIRGDGATTIANNANIATATGSATLLELNKVYKFTFFDGIWIEQSNSSAEGASTPANFFATSPIIVTKVGDNITFSINQALLAIAWSQLTGIPATIALEDILNTFAEDQIFLKNIAVGTASIPSNWTVAYRIAQLGATGFWASGETAEHLSFGSNAILDNTSGTWKRRQAGFAMLCQMANGVMTFFTAASAAGGTEISWQVQFRLNADRTAKFYSSVGFNSIEPIAPPALGAAATDLATALTLVNNIRTALINLGLCTA